MRTCLTMPLMILAPVLALAQAVPGTGFPEGATALAPEALQARLLGKSFVAQPANGPVWRLQYRTEYAFINVGNASDSGPWRVQGDTLCLNWQRFPSGCLPVRLAGDTLYLQRNSGEVVAMREQP